MFDELPSLRGFQPDFYSGGPIRFHLPLLYDLAAATSPKVAVVIGIGEGEGFFTLFQAANQPGNPGECIAIRRNRADEPESEDAAWREAVAYGQEVYGERAGFISSSHAALANIADESVDLLLIDDSDLGSAIAADLKTWESKLATRALVLVHGIGLEREDGPNEAWKAWVGKRPVATFPTGLALAVARHGKATPAPAFFKFLFGRTAKVQELTAIYRLVAERVDAAAHASKAERTSAGLEMRQV